MVQSSRKVQVAPLVPLALAFAVGIITDRFYLSWPTVSWAVVALVTAVLGSLALRRWPLVGSLGTLALTFALGAGWHHAFWFDLASDDLARWITETPRPAWVRGVLRDVQGVHPGDPVFTRAVLEITGVNDRGSWRGASGRAQIVITGARSDLVGGEAVDAAGRLSRVAGPLNPGEFDARQYLRAQGIRLHIAIDDPRGVWSSQPARNWRWIRWRGLVRSWSRARLVEGLDPRIAPLAAALLLGQREGVDPEINDAFARTGTTHLLAISGLHLQALGLVLFYLFRLLGVGRRSSFVLVALATVAYALLVGLAPSVIRSAAMTVVACTAGILDRSVRPANILALAALVTLGLNPAYLFDVGCQLSFLAIAAIIWGSTPVFAWWVTPAEPLDRLEQRLEPVWRRRVRGCINWFAQMFVVSLVVWLITLPLVTLRFHMFSPIGVMLNLPLIPLTTVALLASALTLGLSVLWAPLAMPAAWVSDLTLKGTDALVRWGAAWPYGHGFVAAPSTAWVLGVYALLALAATAQAGLWPRLSRRVAWGVLSVWVVLGLTLSLVRLPWHRGSLEAEVLAVGHGLAVVVSTADGRTWLYDCGRMRDPAVGRRIIAPALWTRGVRHLEAIILSHADSDHYNGLTDLLERFSVGEVRVPPGFGGVRNPGAIRLLDEVKRRGVPVRLIAEGEHWEAAGTRFLVWHPPPAEDRTRSAELITDNSRSVVLDLESDGHHFWLTGDLEAEGLFEFHRHVAPPEGLDVMLAPHHGGRTANPRWLYDWAGPRLVVVSQRPPMPGTKDALAMLDEQKMLMRTWQQGSIRLRWTPQGVVPHGFRDDQGGWND